METLNKVLLTAGTHGNELSGIYINKLIKQGLFQADRSTFKTQSIIANPEAVKRNVRFVESDLNREFGEVSSTTLEAEVAKGLKQEHAQTKQQLIIDLHNTTSNMGATLILLSNSAFYRKMGAYVKKCMPEANILFEDRKAWHQQPYLCSMGEHGVMIEVGAQAHGSLKVETLELMKSMLTAVLDYVENHNLNEVESLPDYDAFYYIEELAAPLDEDGMRGAAVHPDVCGQDFKVVKAGEPLLVRFTGEEILWSGEQDIYPHFINEAAYNAANLTMALAEKKRVSASN